MLSTGTDLESNITEYTLVYEDKGVFENGWDLGAEGSIHSSEGIY